jgi:short-subunit dehydrogenase
MKLKTKALIVAAGVGAAVLIRNANRKIDRSFLGQVVLITGGSKGLGLQLAREFASRGAKIAICARDAAELERAQHDLEARGYEVITRVCDVTQESQVKATIDAVVAHYSKIDVLVNNAGAIQVGPVENMEVTDFKEAMDVIFWGTLYPILAVTPKFMAQNSGKIVNISSIGGKVSVPHLVPYSAAKFAVAGLSEGLRSELAKYNVSVTAIFPGLMRTGSAMNAHFRGRTTQEAEWFTAGAMLPGMSIDAARAARKIVDSTRDGHSERVIGGAAKTLARVHDIFPEKTIEIVGMVASALLPAIGGSSRMEGAALKKWLGPAVKLLLWAGQRTAKNLNQSAA